MSVRQEVRTPLCLPAQVDVEIQVQMQNLVSFLASRGFAADSPTRREHGLLRDCNLQRLLQELVPWRQECSKPSTQAARRWTATPSSRMAVAEHRTAVDYNDETQLTSDLPTDTNKRFVGWRVTPAGPTKGKPELGQDRHA